MAPTVPLKLHIRGELLSIYGENEASENGAIVSKKFKNLKLSVDVSDSILMKGISCLDVRNRSPKWPLVYKNFLFTYDENLSSLCNK